MKKRKIFATGMTALLLLFGMVLVGCGDSDDDGNSNGNDNPTAPSIGIDTTGFNALTAVTLPSGLTNVKTTTPGQQLQGVEASKTYRVADASGTGEGGLLAAFRTAGGIPVTWDNTGDNAAAFWKDTALTNVRADVTLTGGTEGNAYLLVWDGTNTYETIKTGFIALYVGNSMAEQANGLNKVSSLTFGATAAGTYTVKITIKKVNGTTGAVIETLAEQTLVFTVAAASAG
jgi:hypothetical protein